jgi:hypothetical protein
VSYEVVGPLERSKERIRSARKSKSVRVLAVEALGPLTILAGIVWAIAQPYRIAFIYRDGKGFYDYLAQPPVLVVVVGLLFALLVAPGLVDDLEDGQGERPPS